MSSWYSRTIPVGMYEHFRPMDPRFRLLLTVIAYCAASGGSAQPLDMPELVGMTALEVATELQQAEYAQLIVSTGRFEGLYSTREGDVVVLFCNGAATSLSVEMEVTEETPAEAAARVGVPPGTSSLAEPVARDEWDVVLNGTSSFGAVTGHVVVTNNGNGWSGVSLTADVTCPADDEIILQLP